MALAVKDVDLLGKTYINVNFNTIYRNSERRMFQSILKKLWPIEFLLLVKRKVKSTSALTRLHTCPALPREALSSRCLTCTESVNLYKSHRKSYYYSPFTEEETELERLCRGRPETGQHWSRDSSPSPRGPADPALTVHTASPKQVEKQSQQMSNRSS